MIGSLAPGFLVTVAVGVCAFLVSRLHDALDALVVALVAGALIRLLFGGRERFVLVSAYAHDLKDVLILIGIVLYAATLDPRASVTLPPSTIVHTLASMVVLFVAALVLGRLLRVPRKTSLLVAAGSAICGVSAIAISSRAVDADDEDVSNSMIAITLVGFLAVALCDGHVIALSDEKLAVFAGATLQQTGLVKIALAGKSVKALGLAVKMIRIACLPIVALGLYLAHARGRKAGRGGWFYVVALLAFAALLAVSATTRLISATEHVATVRVFSTIVFATAVANVGLLVDVRKIRGRPIIAALGAWACAVALMFLMR